MKKIDANMSVKDAFDELQEITKQFEQDSLDLEKSIPLYKRAVLLSNHLKKRLKNIEQQIEEVQLTVDES